MKKNLFRAAFLLVVGCCMVACSGSDDVTTTDTPQQPQQPAANQAVQLEGTLGAKAGMTRSIDTNGKGSWEPGDQFAIYYPTTSGNATAIATVSGVNSEGGAEFKATLYGPKLDKSTVKFIYPATAHDGRGGIKKSVLANQEGTLDYISKQLDIETGEGTIDVESRGSRDPKATLTANTILQPQVCIYQFNLKKANGTTTSDLSATKFVAKDGTNTYTVSPAAATSSFCIAMLPAANADFKFTASTNESAKIYKYQCDFDPDEITTDHLGCVIATDGNVYKYSQVDGIEYSKSFTGKTIESAKFYSQDLKLDGGPSVTPVAMIAYVGDKTGEDAEGYIQEGVTCGTDTYTHGLAVALDNIGGDTPSNGQMFKWKTDNNKTVVSNTYRETSTDAVKIKKESGYQYVKRFGTSLTTPTTSDYYNEHPAYAAAADYNVPGFDNSTYHCSGWFLGSVYQWNLIVTNYRGTDTEKWKNYTNDIINLYPQRPNTTAFVAFWTCTEGGVRSDKQRKAWYIASYTSYGLNQDAVAGNARVVRPIFAF